MKARGAKDARHGDQVAYGLLVHLAVEGADDEAIVELMRFYGAIGLPRSLPDLGMPDPSSEEIGEIACWTMTEPHLAKTSATVTKVGVAGALERIERLAERLLVHS